MTRQRRAAARPVAVLLAALLLAGCDLGTRASGGAAPDAVAPRRRLFLVVVDGLDARDVGDEQTPTLSRYWHEGAWCPGARGVAAMPARTNVSHASLLSGVHPAVHGVTGNVFWDRSSGSPRKLGLAADLLTETLFTVAGRSRPDLRTAAAVGKGKLAAMFAATPGGQIAPGRVWEPKAAPSAGRDGQTGYAYDQATLAAARDLVAHAPVDFLFANLADVDRVSHGTGPRSAAAARARGATDAALEEFLAFLRARGDWKDTTVIVTADHGFDTVERPPIDFGERARTADLTGLVSVGDGGVGHLYLREPEDGGAERLLGAARRLALATPGIAEALYLRRNALDGGDAYTLDAVHADWHLAHERSGDLLLIGASGSVFADGDADEAHLKGNHGGPGDRAVPIVVVQGGGRSPGDPCDDLTLADLGRTIMTCLGLRDVERLDGRAIPPDGRGRILQGLCP